MLSFKLTIYSTIGSYGLIVEEGPVLATDRSIFTHLIILVMCNINNFIYCLSRLLHTYLSRYDKLSRYMFHHCVKDVNIGDTCNNEVLNYNTA